MEWNPICVALYNHFELTQIGTHIVAFIFGVLLGGIGVLAWIWRNKK